MRVVVPSLLLRRALVADAVASGAVALAQLAGGDALAGALALPRGLLLETGAFLAAYTALLVVMARRPRLPAALVQLVVVGNVGWALAAVAILAEGLVAPGVMGAAWLLAQAAATAGLAAWERAGLRASVGANGVAATARALAP